MEGWKMPAQMSSETPVVGRCGAERHHVASLPCFLLVHERVFCHVCHVPHVQAQELAPCSVSQMCHLLAHQRSAVCDFERAPVQVRSFCTTSRATCRRRDGTQGLSRPPRASVDTGFRLFSDCLGVIPYWQHRYPVAHPQPSWPRGGLGHDARVGGEAWRRFCFGVVLPVGDWHRVLVAQRVMRGTTNERTSAL